MIEKLLKIDKKGILAPDYVSENDYARQGRLILETAKTFMMTEELKELFLEEGIRADAAFRMPPPIARRIKSVFRTDLSWVVVVPGTYKETWPTALTTRLPCALKGEHLEMPLICYFTGGEPMLFHEGVHIIRSFINSQSDSFEEAFANYGVSQPVHRMVQTELLFDNKLMIDDARKKLEDVIGENAAYALVRLSKDEVYTLKGVSDALGYLKGLNCLRHRIIKERLGI